MGGLGWIRKDSLVLGGSIWKGAFGFGAFDTCMAESGAVSSRLEAKRE